MVLVSGLACRFAFLVTLAKRLATRCARAILKFQNSPTMKQPPFHFRDDSVNLLIRFCK